jgi:hypothetical protein
MPILTYTFPLHEYFSDENINGCSITGGFVYRGKKYPSLYGKYIYGDYCSGKIWALKRNADGSYTNNLVYDHSNNVLTTFGQDASGELYFADVNMSSIYKIGDTCKFNFSVITTDPVCPGATNGMARTNLNPGINAQFTWSNGDTSEIAENLPSGLYTVSVLYNGCLTSKSFEIKSKPSNKACINMPSKTEFCLSDSVQLMACDYPAAVIFSWYRDSIKFVESTENSIVINQTGSYQVVITDSLGCQSGLSEAISITIYPLPEPPELLIQSDTLTATPGYSKYTWYWNNQLIGSTSENQYIAVLEGSYRVEVSDSNNCKSLLSNVVTFVHVHTKNQDKSIRHFELLPNPVINYLTIISREKSHLGDLSYAIISMQFKEIQTGKIPGFKDTAFIDINSLNAGMYWIRLKHGRSESKLPFIKIDK